MHEKRTGLRKLSEQPIQKAARLLRENRVHHTGSVTVYTVEGDTDVYQVTASTRGIFCPCEAREPLCSHVLAVAHLRGAERALSNGDSLTEAVA